MKKTSIQNLKKAAGKNIILSPQPSDQPDDPLNWSKKIKTLYFIGILLTSVGPAIMGPLLVPAFNELSSIFDVPLTTVAQLNGGLVMSLGVSSYLCNQLSSIYGKRLLFLLTSLCQVVIAIWGACSKSFRSLIAARIFQGLFMGMSYSAAGTSSIADVFFVHERAKYVGIWSFVLLTTNNITPIISGYVIEDLSWKWSFGFLAIYLFVCLVFHFFLVPESAFKRDTKTEVFYQGVSKAESLSVHDQKKEYQVSAASESSGLQDTKEYSFKKSLRVYRGRQSELSLFYVLFRPWLMLQNPIVIWGVLQWCLCYTWVIMIGSVASQMFTAPPYNFSVSSTGVISGVAPLIGTTIGTLASGTISDYLIDFMARKNNGVYEPEFRLFMMIPYMILLLIGGFGTGWQVENGKSWISVAVYLAILFCGVACGVTSIITYTVDSLGDCSGEAFGLMMLVKSAFAYGLIWKFNTWYAERGAKSVYGIMSGATCAVILLSIPMYIFGKRGRLYVKQHGIYKVE